MNAQAGIAVVAIAVVLVGLIYFRSQIVFPGGVLASTGVVR